MTERSREFVLAVLLVAFLIAGVAADVLGDPVQRSESARIPGPRFTELASFCPPSPKDVKVHSALVMGSAGDVSVGIEPALPERIDLAGGRTKLEPRLNIEDGVDVVGYGENVPAAYLGTFSGPIRGIAAAECSSVSSDRWYFGAGSSAIGYDERILLYNPYPDEAVVRITFFSKTTAKTPVNLSKLAVPARGSTSVAVNEFVPAKDAIGAQVDVQRGRVVAWREMFSKKDGKGVELTLGAPAPARTWYLAEGAVADGVSEQVAILNPTEREAAATLSLVSKDGPVQPPKLVDFKIGPLSLFTVDLKKYLSHKQQDLGGVSAVLRSTDVPLVVERRLTYLGGEPGVTAEMGSSATGTYWQVPPAALHASSDAVVIFNPQPRAATVSITMYALKGEPQSPSSLSGIRVPAGGRTRVRLLEWTKGKPLIATVQSSEPVVAERAAYSAGLGDVSVLLGIRVLTPSAP